MDRRPIADASNTARKAWFMLVVVTFQTTATNSGPSECMICTVVAVQRDAAFRSHGTMISWLRSPTLQIQSTDRRAMNLMMKSQDPALMALNHRMVDLAHDEPPERQIGRCIAASFHKAHLHCRTDNPDRRCIALGTPRSTTKLRPMQRCVAGRIAATIARSADVVRPGPPAQLRAARCAFRAPQLQGALAIGVPTACTASTRPCWPCLSALVDAQRGAPRPPITRVWHR
jgi:hypothetical protein